MPPKLRKASLAAHIGCSVGWLGAVVGFLALAIAAMTAEDLQVVRAAYIAMDLMGWSALVPLSVATLLTGIIQSLGTAWGLIRHYWVLMKLLITVLATAILMMYMQTLRHLSDSARGTELAAGEILPNFSPVLHAGAGLLVLLVALVLSVFKPRGITGWGLHRKSSVTT
ncbi:DUF2269 domain-containing protein [Glutamicibacter sp. AOP38-B1-38]|uniref:DUF2269 domain-containing protein n=1 Tax=Glutamicibacter sp. AOP38-B1-38 TaxID=3457680 RepID=UPI0040337C05